MCYNARIHNTTTYHTCHGLRHIAFPPAFVAITTRAKCLHPGAAEDAVRPQPQERFQFFSMNAWSETCHLNPLPRTEAPAVKEGGNVWHGKAWYSMVAYGIVWCRTLWNRVAWCGAAWYGMCVHAIVETMTGMRWSERCPAAELRAPPAAESTKKTRHAGASGSSCEVGGPKEVAP